MRSASSDSGAGTRFITVNCMPGEVVTGGGYAFTSPDNPGDNLTKETLVVESRPAPSSGTGPTGWYAEAKTIGGGNYVITAYAICVDITP